MKRSTPLAAMLLAAAITVPTLGTAPAGAAAPAKKATPTITVLVTNDDGVGAPGLDAVVEALRALKKTKVVVVAPATNQSGSGSKTTPGGAPGAPATTASGYEATAVTGFPADAVDYALDVLKVTPNVVISGSNSNQNLGTNTEASGTVGAARQAARRSIPALAVSSQLGDNPDFPTSAQLAVTWLKEHRKALAKKTTIDGTPRAEIDNLNVPTCPGGANGPYETVLAPKDTAEPLLTTEPNCASTLTSFTSDAQAFNNGYASVTKVTVPAAAG